MKSQNEQSVPVLLDIILTPTQKKVSYYVDIEGNILMSLSDGTQKVVASAYQGDAVFSLPNGTTTTVANFLNNSINKMTDAYILDNWSVLSAIAKSYVK